MAADSEVKQMEVYDFRSGSQPRQQFDPNSLNAKDRRLCLGSMLWFVIRRYGRGQPVLREDLLRMLALADDADGKDGARA
jgi:hypothetical protein